MSHLMYVHHPQIIPTNPVTEDILRVDNGYVSAVQESQGVFPAENERRVRAPLGLIEAQTVQVSKPPCPIYSKR